MCFRVLGRETRRSLQRLERIPALCVQSCREKFPKDS
jgi:hypothetical protein